MKRKRFLDFLQTWDPGGFESEDEKLPFPMKKGFLDIVSAIQNGILVPVLGPSVNPAVYVDLAAFLVRLSVERDFPNDPQVAGERDASGAPMGFRGTCPARFSMSRGFRWPRPTVET